MLKPDAQREKILDLLEHAGGVTEASVKEISEQTGVPEADIWGTGKFYSLIDRPEKRVRVCDGLSCQMAGADAVAESIEADGIACERVSCLGQCDLAVATLTESMKLKTYGEKQKSISPADCELPIDLAGPIDTSYAALGKVISMTPEAVIDEIEASGLQGRGGAGFPAHIKWRSVCDQHETERYVICNADEAEPGTFKDRETILRQPHKILEGLAIAATVIQTREIYIYIRGEYGHEFDSINQAIQTAQAVDGPLQNFNFTVVRGHGAYICGEETALLESLEGKRGMPRLKPPFPTQSGFRGKPSLIHNVETIACVPFIIHHRGETFKKLGRTEAGSKLYCISGHVVKPGVYELPLGVTLDELVDAAGGYVGSPLAFSPGGASSGFLPIRMRDLPLDYRNLAAVDSMMGSAGVVVLNDTIDMAMAAQWQLKFFERESCGQCAPCRIGSRYLRRQNDQYLQSGDPIAFRHADDVAWEMEEGSICGLGMVAAKPLESARKHFPDHFGVK